MAPLPARAVIQRFPSIQLPIAIKLSQLLMLLGLFLSKLIEMDPWILKVITGGSRVTHTDGAIPYE